MRQTDRASERKKQKIESNKQTFQKRDEYREKQITQQRQAERDKPF